VSINYARLNHILIPSSKDQRDRWRRGRLARITRPFGFAFAAMSDEGRALSLAQIAVGVLSIDVQATQSFMLWGLLVGLLAASIVASVFYRMRHVRLVVSAPPRITVGSDVTFSITAHNDGEDEHRSIRLRGPFLPWDGAWLRSAPSIQVLKPGASARVEAGARFVARGEHHLDPFTAAALVPLHLANGPKIESSGVRFLVVPKIANVVRVTTSLASRHQPGGVALASKTGESMELLGVRPYRPGDPLRHLHARTWARVGTPVVREYQEEYFSRVGVVLETAIEDERVLEAAVSLAAGVIAHLSRGEALIDLLVVGETVHNLTIGRSLGFLEQALDVLACVEPARESIDADRLASRLAAHLSRLSCVVVVAPSWDGGALATRIRGHGVACVTAVFDGAKGRSRDVVPITVDAIERGEAISL
jgi:uncharacterized protein (DUF58 family)